MPKKKKGGGPPPPPPFEHIVVPLSVPKEVPPLQLPCTAGSYYISSIAVKRPGVAGELYQFLCIEHKSGLKACCPEDALKWVPIVRQPVSLSSMCRRTSICRPSKCAVPRPPRPRPWPPSPPPPRPSPHPPRPRPLSVLSPRPPPARLSILPRFICLVSSALALLCTGLSMVVRWRPRAGATVRHGGHASR